MELHTDADGVDEQEIRRRIVRRGKDEDRSDDTLETLNYRLEQYRQQTMPLVEFYAHREKLRVVDGMGSPTEVLDRVSLCIRSVLPLEPCTRQKEAG